METWSRSLDGMDLLKEITNELRGGDEASNDDGATTDDVRANDDDHAKSTDDAAVDAESVARSTTATNGSGGADPESNGQSTPGDEDEVDASGKRDDHLCSFCETEFDASRTVCPECDAEIVVRGAR